MVPQPAHVLDELAVVIDQRIVNGDDAAGAVAGFRVVLQPGQTTVAPGSPHPNQSRPASG